MYDSYCERCIKLISDENYLKTCLVCKRIISTWECNCAAILFNQS